MQYKCFFIILFLIVGQQPALAGDPKNSPSVIIINEPLGFFARLLIAIAPVATQILAQKYLSANQQPPILGSSYSFISTDKNFCSLAGSMPEELNNAASLIKQNQPIKTIVLHGAPGTGKTLLAEAFAGEINALFYKTSGPSFINKFVGDSAKNVESLFTAANKLAEKHPQDKFVICIDEVESVACSRKTIGEDGSKEYHGAVTELLTQIDKLKPNVTLIVTTNYINQLDAAFLRSGRTDYKVEVMVPGKKDREEILHHYAPSWFSSIKNQKTIEKLVAGTDQYTPADLQHLIKHANQAYDRNALPCPLKSTSNSGGFFSAKNYRLKNTNLCCFSDERDLSYLPHKKTTPPNKTYDQCLLDSLESLQKQKKTSPENDILSDPVKFSLYS